MMKPYAYNSSLTPEEINFNAKLSSARRVSENAFGHLKARFRKIGKGLEVKIDNTNKIIKAACVLHNFLNNNNDTINKHWVNQMNSSEVARRREYPDQMTDRADLSGMDIRSAIAKFLYEKNQDALRGRLISFISVIYLHLFKYTTQSIFFFNNTDSYHMLIYL